MAQKALFITINDLKRKSIIDGNVDADKLIQFIEVAQDTHIQNYLGGLLYNKIQSLIINNTIDDAGNSDYKTLLEEMRMMLAKVTETAEFYTRRFVDYMDYNNTLFPEYTSSTNGEMYPDKDVNFNSWVL